jgi:hypothetical protein
MQQITEGGGEGAGGIGVEFLEGDRSGYLVFEALNFFFFEAGFDLGFLELSHESGLFFLEGGDLSGGLELWHGITLLKFSGRGRLGAVVASSESMSFFRCAGE